MSSWPSGDRRLIGVRSIWLTAVTLTVLLTASNALAARGVKKFCCMVRMRDGTRLATDVYLPRFPRRPYPVILIRTPYGKHEIAKRQARFVCRRGCALVVQDMRGRYGSGGSDALVFHSDGWAGNRDGHDTIRWIARQGWCNGNIGTWGPSAMGVVQNMLAPDAPKALKAQHVMMAFSNMYTQAAYQGGALRKALVEGWLREHGFSGENLQAVLAHPKYDQQWAELNPEAQAHRVNAPAVFWGGWHDAFLQGTINSFLTVHNQGGPRARGKCRLILGPWDHGDIQRLADPRCAGCWPRAGDAFRFFDYWLRGVCNGVPWDKAVHYYVMGDSCDPTAPGNRWRSADNWPPPSQPTKFYFHTDGTLRNTPASDPGGKLVYKYDPSNPVPTLGGQNLNLAKGPRDQRPVESRPDVLLFTSDPLTEAVEVTGHVFAVLYVSSDSPDTDFTVKLTDVYPDGRSMLLSDGILRARFRESFEREDFLEPGKVYPLNVDLWSTAVVLNKGHRIRVAVSSSNAPRFEPNPNTGRPPGQSVVGTRRVPSALGETRIATNTLHLSKQHPSHIILPVYRGSK